MITEDDVLTQCYSTKVSIFDVDLWDDGDIIFDVQDFSVLGLTVEELRSLLALADEFIEERKKVKNEC